MDPRVVAHRKSLLRGRGRGRSIGRREVSDDQCIKMGDIVVLSSIEEDENAYLASSAISDELVVVQPATKNR
jgi:hypothetical protein